MTTTKKLMVLCVVTALFILMGWGYVYMNLKANSVYYAQQMPRDKVKDPELVMLIDNLGWMYMPEIEGFRYGFDGTRTIFYEEENFEQGFPRIGNSYGGEEGTNYIYVDENNNSYMHNKNFELIYVVDADTWEEVDITTVDEEAIRAEIHELVQPVLEKQLRSPELDLQWLFNWIYGERFR